MQSRNTRLLRDTMTESPPEQRQDGEGDETTTGRRTTRHQENVIVLVRRSTRMTTRHSNIETPQFPLLFVPTVFSHD